MSLLKVLILAIVQGLAELLPVSSSAHVVVAEKLLGLDPTTPEMTLILVMLHTGTMFAVIVYFWNQWKRSYFATADAFKRFAIRAIWATLLTAIIGYPIIELIEKTAFKGLPKADIEQLFGRLDLVAAALFAAGLLILWAGTRQRDAEAEATTPTIAPSRALATTSPSGKLAGWERFRAFACHFAASRAPERRSPPVCSPARTASEPSASASLWR